MKETNEADMLLTPLPAVPKIRHLNDVRRIDSPLPAVPLPPKISRSPNPSRSATNFNRSVSLMSASCDDLRRPPAKPSRNKSNVVKIIKTASVNFDSLSLIPTIEDPFLQELRTNDTNFGVKSYPTNSAAHDYEELIENVRTVHTENSSANINNMNSQVHALPQQPSPSIVISSNHDQLSCDRERQNPMFSGMRPLSPIPNILDSPSFSKIRSPRNVLGPKSACILVAGVITAILISLISLVIIFMYFLGVLRPINFPDTVDQKSFIDLQNEVNVLRNALLIQGINTNDTISVQRAKISELKTDLFKLNSRKSEVQANDIREQLESVVTSMNSTEIARLFGSMSGRRLPLSHSCRHESFAIGSSAVQDVTDSGEYYADEDYVITGATCSSSAGFIGSMETRRAVVDGVDRNYYKCKCIRIAGSAAPSSGRVECRIDYWQCPLSAVRLLR